MFAMNGYLLNTTQRLPSDIICSRSSYILDQIRFAIIDKVDQQDWDVKCQQWYL